MTPKNGGSDGGLGGIRRSGDDAVKLTIDYVKQETLDPLKGLGRFLAWGLGGSFAIAIGVLLLLIGILRLLQDETGSALTGNWSWVPYFVVAFVGLAVAGVAAWRITKGPAEPKLPKVKARQEAEHAEFSGAAAGAVTGAPVVPPVVPPTTATAVTAPIISPTETTTETQEGNN
jgi:hypothetical protein